MRKIRAEIHLQSIRHNAQAFKALTKKKLCAVVKADAYGHGAEEVAQAIEHIVDVFAVALLSEAVALRVAACGKDILILTPPTCLEDAVQAVKNRFIITVAGLTDAKIAAQAARLCGMPARVHLKGNTGMNRYGMGESELGKTCKFLQVQESVFVEGLYSHLYDLTKAGAYRSRTKFLQLQTVCKRYFPDVTCHLSATYGTLLGEDFFFDMTRVGIGLYGYLPDGAKDIPSQTVEALALQKGMTVYAYAVASRTYTYGGMGYGKVPKSTKQKQVKRLAIYRFGYADGVLRNKDNGTCGYEKNANCLCMDACVRIGRTEKGRKTRILYDAAQTAQAVESISYEVLCAITRRAERVYDDR